MARATDPTGRLQQWSRGDAMALERLAPVVARVKLATGRVGPSHDGTTYGVSPDGRRPPLVAGTVPE